ncbi:MAG: hypothetical protein U5R06_11090 [candidate division KSB1 bacterium]|nr:hypothetical protein [candidate division KSB1 bacterium]
MQSNNDKLLPAVWGGVTIGILSGVPVLNFINCACCSGILIGGALSVYLYRRQVGPECPSEDGEGASLGLLAGLFGAVLATLLSLVIQPFSQDIIYQIQNYTNDPDIENMLNHINPEMLAKSFTLIAFISSLVINSLFGLLGGVIGIGIWGKPKSGQPVPKKQSDKAVVWSDPSRS